MFEPIATIAILSLTLFGMIWVAWMLLYQLRMQRHLSRLKNIPLEQWPGKR